MKAMMRYVGALLAVVALLGAAVLALFGWVTTAQFAREVNGTQKLQTLQQLLIDRAADGLNERWQLAEDVLSPWTEDAAARQGEAVAVWWGALWQDADADTALPAWLTAEQEAILVADVRGDAGFIALTDENQRRAIARDEVAFALDEAVCDAVTPLRRSIVAMALDVAGDLVPLPMIRKAALIGAASLAVLAVVLLIVAHRAAGSALVCAGVTMAALTIPVWLADIPGMLEQLSRIAVQQGSNALACMALLWYGAALAEAVCGLIIIGVKKALRGERE